MKKIICSVLVTLLFTGGITLAVPSSRRPLPMGIFVQKGPDLYWKVTKLTEDEIYVEEYNGKTKTAILTGRLVRHSLIGHNSNNGSGTDFVRE